MFSEIIINVHPFETRVAILEDNRLAELFVEKKEQANIVGNIYKGIVQDILPAMGAAFINIGLDRTAFLHFSDLCADFLEETPYSKKHPLHKERDSSKIIHYIKEGQEITVQVQKGPLGKKGARLTGQISLPGKYLVMLPYKSNIAISRKIQSFAERNRIKATLSEVKHDNIGLIVRTDTDNVSTEEFTAEYKGLYKTWEFIQKQMQYAKAPVCIFNENDLSNTLIRDLFSSKIDRLVVDNKQFRDKMVSYLHTTAPELSDRIELYCEDSPIFDAYGIEREIENIFNARINLPSGGNIVIERAEALVAVDVNTGSFVGRSYYENTVKLTNVEAANEVARQLRLRDLSGITVIDFIDMESEQSRQEVLDTLRKALKRDRAKNKAYPFGALGLVEVTRKRTRNDLMATYSEHCPHCKGSGRILSRDSVAMKIYRWLSRAEYFIMDNTLRIIVHPNVKDFFDKNPEYFKSFTNPISILSDDQLSPARYKIVDAKTGRDITQKFNV